MKTRKATAAMKAHAATLPRYNFIDFQQHAINEIARSMGVRPGWLTGGPYSLMEERKSKAWDTFRYQKMPSSAPGTRAYRLSPTGRRTFMAPELGMGYAQAEARVSAWRESNPKMTAAVAESIRDLDRYRSHEDRAKRLAVAFDAVGVAASVTAKKWADAWRHVGKVEIIKGRSVGRSTTIEVSNNEHNDF